MTGTADFRTWQLIDSAFPTGGFAHSGGIEAAVQIGAVRDADDLDGFLRDTLAQWAGQSGPLTAGAWDGDAALATLDAWADALLAGNTIAAAASRAQGVAFLMAAQHLAPALAELRAACRGAPCHLAVMLGAAGRCLALPRATVLGIGAFLALRGVLSAAVRLNVIGPLAAQGMQAGLEAAHAAAVASAAATPWRAAASRRPFLELEQGQHDRLYSRLFQS